MAHQDNGGARKLTGIFAGAVGGVLLAQLVIGLAVPFMVSADCETHLRRMEAERVDIYRPDPVTGEMTADKVRAQECLRPAANFAVGGVLVAGVAGGFAGARLFGRRPPGGPR